MPRYAFSGIFMGSVVTPSTLEAVPKDRDQRIEHSGNTEVRCNAASPQPPEG